MSVYKLRAASPAAARPRARILLATVARRLAMNHSSEEEEEEEEQEEEEEEEDSNASENSKKRKAEAPPPPPSSSSSPVPKDIEAAPEYKDIKGLFIAGSSVFLPTRNYCINLSLVEQIEVAKLPNIYLHADWHWHVKFYMPKKAPY